MRARLQGDIERGAARRHAGPAQRLRLGMRPAADLGPAAADDHAILYDHRADGGVGPGPPQAAPPEIERELHEAAVGLFLGAQLLADLIFQDAEDHLRTGASRGGASSSALSSPSTASKSLASRKLRYTEAKRT